MKSTIEITANSNITTESNDFVKRLSVLAYGMVSYAVGCFGLFWLILGAGGLAPVGISEWQSDTLLGSILVNAGLITLFGLQHSIMARSGFKKWITRVIPEAAERSTFMLMSGIASCIAVYFWQSLPGTVWQVENEIASMAITATYAFGVVYLLLSTLVTNHFELMGLRQVYLYFRNKPYTALPFTKKYMYSYSRHPMMLGVLLLLWAIPVMSMTHLVLSIMFTLYMAVGMYFEERDLVKNFGETYRKYKKEIATFVPGMY